MTLAIVVLGVSVALLAVCVPLVARRARHRARVDVLDQLGRTYGIEPMVEMGTNLQWIEAVQEQDDGVRVRVRR